MDTNKQIQKRSIEAELREEINKQGADFVFFVDISHLPDHQNRKYPNAVLVGLVLSPEYLQKITLTPDYVQKMIQQKQFDIDQFHLKEIQTDLMADDIAYFLNSKGFSACSQSEKNISSIGFYDERTKSTPLPHKTIALMAGLGWIGKHNLLVSPKYGSALSMCTILTDAPLKTVLYDPKESACGNCTRCIHSCPVNALSGNTWTRHTGRDELLDINVCTTCLQCLVLCPYTQKFIQNELKAKEDHSRS
ncbi:MAG: 4Fe-4S dicluster domain-containing protein [Prolixibacteraceae bacterium]